MISDPTKRFSNRVDNYVKYRPGYPPEVLAWLKDECKLTPHSVIADIGAGTGIFTKLLLDEDYKVYAVEPNEAMRNTVEGTAGATILAANSIDLVVCAQAFHWFNNKQTQAEFHRVLKPGGKAALIWNNRLTDAGKFLKAYDLLLRDNSIDYNKVNHQNVNDIDFKAFFKNGVYKLVKFPNEQVFDEAGLQGRAFSSSYVPPEDTEDGQKFLVLLKQLFNQYNVNGKVSFRYQTEIYLGDV